MGLNGKSHSHLKCPNFSETLNMHDGVESKPVQGKMLGQVHDLTLPIMDGHLYILVRVFSSCEFLVDFLCKCVFMIDL